MTNDELEAGFDRLREEWPAGSMVGEVMARIDADPLRRRRPRMGLVAGAAAMGLAASLLLAALIILSQPKDLLAAVQGDLKNAQAAHLVTTVWDDREQEAGRFEIWYRRGEGLRAELPGQVIVEDGSTQWSWQTGPPEGGRVVLRQRSPGFFTTMLPGMLSLSEVREGKPVRAQELDRPVDGHACQASIVEIHAVGPPARGIVLAEPGGRIREIKLERRRGDGAWHREREIRIEYDVPIPAEKLASRLPEGARVIDRDGAFDSLYPFDRALHRVELGGLILAVHDIQPLVDREGFYVVSSVRGTPEFLRQYPPRRRPVNWEVVAIDVAYQPMGNGMMGGKYDRIVLGTAARNGVEFCWWLLIPRKFFMVKDGKREYQPQDDVSAMPGEPGRLDDLPGKARVRLGAIYWDETHRDARGVQQEVSTWAEVPLPPDRPPATIEHVAARARRDMLAMGAGGAGSLLGIAADSKPDGNTLRPTSHFAPESVTDGDFAAAVRRGLDDLRNQDEVRPIGSDDILPPAGGDRPRQSD
ncbi:hypothetical protein OJF2_31030 [Aquisphaera giovannonii]|uniref:Uncharacterized protein n=1 Tax=Aquisphaera giovannonii TaxID=406548 RepID=A0A5B9W1N1_9BACT|nr:hypothetical protein [Aquisphaera giovannonii]QEH34562.1 hypothetical protein OJF2_31030 [Aquisphaera giovannonii]